MVKLIAFVAFFAFFYCILEYVLPYGGRMLPDVFPLNPSMGVSVGGSILLSLLLLMGLNK